MSETRTVDESLPREPLREMDESLLRELMQELNDLVCRYREGLGYDLPWSPWFTGVCAIPMQNIKCKIKAFEPYFHKLNVKFPNLEEYFGGHLILTKDTMKSLPVIIVTHRKKYTLNGEEVEVCYKSKILL